MGKIIIGAIDTQSVEKMTEEKSVGVVIQYFAKVQAAAVQITDGEIKVGDTLRFKGSTTDFEQRIDSMQVDRNPIQNAKAGEAVGIAVKERVRPNDKVFLVQ